MIQGLKRDSKLDWQWKILASINYLASPSSNCNQQPKYDYSIVCKAVCWIYRDKRQPTMSRCQIRIQKQTLVIATKQIPDHAILEIASKVRSLMYSRKSVGRMELWGILAVTGHSYKDFPCRNTWRHLLLRKDKIRPIPDQKFWKT